MSQVDNLETFLSGILPGSENSSIDIYQYQFMVAGAYWAFPAVQKIVRGC
jgi:hypothetical protein